METTEILVRNLLEVFNEKDENRRLSAIRRLYATCATFYEQDESFSGHDAINRRVSEVLQTLPPDATFRPTGPTTTNHDLYRLPWILSAEDGPALASGMDVAILAGDKIHRLYIFIDPGSDA